MIGFVKKIRSELFKKRRQYAKHAVATEMVRGSEEISETKRKRCNSEDEFKTNKKNKSDDLSDEEDLVSCNDSLNLSTVNSSTADKQTPAPTKNTAGIFNYYLFSDKNI